MPIDRTKLPKVDPSEGENPLQAALRLYNQPIAKDIPGGQEALDKFAQPGLNTSPTMAKLKGFLSGAAGAINPALIAQAASLGHGVPAMLANAAIAGQGAHEALDPSLPTWKRVLGGVGVIPAVSGVASGYKTLKAGQKVASAVGDIANETKAATQGTLQDSLASLRKDVDAGKPFTEDTLATNYPDLHKEVTKNPGGKYAMEIWGEKGKPGPLPIAKKAEQLIKDKTNDAKAHDVSFKQNQKDAAEDLAIQMEREKNIEAAKKGTIKDINEGFKANADATKGLAKAEATTEKVVGKAQGAAGVEDAKRTAQVAKDQAKSNVVDTREVQRDQKNLADTQAWAAKRQAEKIADSNAISQQSKIDEVTGREGNEVTGGDRVTQTTKGQGPNGEAQTLRETIGPKPEPKGDEGGGGAAPDGGVEPGNPGVPPGPKTLHWNRKDAVAEADKFGGPDKWNIIKTFDDKFRLVPSHNPYAEDVPDISTPDAPVDDVPDVPKATGPFKPSTPYVKDVADDVPPRPKWDNGDLSTEEFRKMMNGTPGPNWPRTPEYDALNKRWAATRKLVGEPEPTVQGDVPAEGGEPPVGEADSFDPASLESETAPPEGGQAPPDEPPAVAPVIAPKPKPKGPAPSKSAKFNAAVAKIADAQPAPELSVTPPAPDVPPQINAMGEAEPTLPNVEPTVNPPAAPVAEAPAPLPAVAPAAPVQPDLLSQPGPPPQQGALPMAPPQAPSVAPQAPPSQGVLPTNWAPPPSSPNGDMNLDEIPGVGAKYNAAQGVGQSAPAGVESSVAPKTSSDIVNDSYRTELNKPQNQARIQKMKADMEQQVAAAKARISAEPNQSPAEWAKAKTAENTTQKLTPEEQQDVEGAKALIDNPATKPLLRETAKRWLTNFMSEKGLGGGQGGAATTNLAMRLGLGAAGGTVGYSEDPLNNKPLSAAAGAGLGFLGPDALEKGVPMLANAASKAQPMVERGLDFANKLHNTGLLGPLSVIKKGAGDAGGLSLAAIENPERAGDILRQFTSSEGRSLLKQNFLEGFNGPGSSAEAGAAGEGASGLENFFQGKDTGALGTLTRPLSWSGRAMGGLTKATKGALGEAGFSPAEQKYYTLTADPAHAPTKYLYYALRGGGPESEKGSKLLQHLSPFARIGVNRLERGWEYSPMGIFSSKMREPEEARKIITKAALGSGVTGMAYGLTPDNFVKDHPAAASTIASLGGPLGIPILAGMAMKSAHRDEGEGNWDVAKKLGAASQTIGRDIPGLRLLEDATGRSFPTGFARNYLSGYTNVGRFPDQVLRKLTGNESEPDVSSPNLPYYQQLLNRAASNVPGLSETLPKKGGEPLFNMPSSGGAAGLNFDPAEFFKK